MKILILPILAVSVASLPAQELRVDFTQTGGNVEVGFEGYFADHEVNESFTTQTFSALGGTVTLTPIWADDMVVPPVDGSTTILDGLNESKQLILRTGDSPQPDLYQDWIGLDGRGALNAGNPLQLILGGIPAGTFSLITHHHDPSNQTGLIDLTITAAGRTGLPVEIDQSAGGGAGATPTVAQFFFISDGSDVILSYSNQAAAAGVNQSGNDFIIINAIEILELEDLDADGLPDAYETNNSLDPNDNGTIGESSPGAQDGPNGALGDPDGDNLTNLQEYNGDDGFPGSGDETNPQLADTDGDTLNDDVEISGIENTAFGNMRTFPFDSDSDDDGLSDGQEISGSENIAFANASTNPNNPDTDGDSMIDFYETTNNQNGGLDPNTADGSSDLDGDTLSNIDEHDGNTLLIQTRADLVDTDDDGLDDPLETNSGFWNSAINTGTNPTIPDSDGDGLLDSQENFDLSTFSGGPGFPGMGVLPTNSDPNILDTDGDEANDLLEVIAGSDPDDGNIVPDFDEDGYSISRDPDDNDSASFPMPAANQLFVDFNSTSISQDGGVHPQAGYQSYDAGHEIDTDFVTMSYPAFGTNISLTPLWPDTAAATTMQSIDREFDYDNNWQADQTDLVTDWIGVDTRTNNMGNGDFDGVTGTPSRFQLSLENLPADSYAWRSYHHDTQAIYSDFLVEISTDDGANFTVIPGPNVDQTFSMSSSTEGRTSVADQLFNGALNPGSIDPADLPSTVNAVFTADGTSNVIIQFTPYSNTDVLRQIFGVNGFELTSTSITTPGPRPVITSFRMLENGDFRMELSGLPNTVYNITRSLSLSGSFETLTTPLTLMTGTAGFGSADIPASEATETRAFFRAEEQQ